MWDRRAVGNSAGLSELFRCCTQVNTTVVLQLHCWLGGYSEYFSFTKCSLRQKGKVGETLSSLKRENSPLWNSVGSEFFAFFVLFWKGSSGCLLCSAWEPKGSLVLLGVECKWVHAGGFDLHLGAGKLTTLIFSKAPQKYCRRLCKTKPFLFCTKVLPLFSLEKTQILSVELQFCQHVPTLPSAGDTSELCELDRHEGSGKSHGSHN